MPKYDFVCAKCGKPETVSMSVPDYGRFRYVLKCDHCGKELKRVYTPVGYMMKA